MRKNDKISIQQAVLKTHFYCSQTNKQCIILQTYFDQILKLLFECCGTDEGFQYSDLHAMSTAHTSSVMRVFVQWKMTALASKEDMVLLGVVILHS